MTTHRDVLSALEVLHSYALRSDGTLQHPKMTAHNAEMTKHMRLIADALQSQPGQQTTLEKAAKQ